MISKYYLTALTIAMSPLVIDASVQIVSCVSVNGATQAPFATSIQTNSLACNTALFTEPLIGWDGIEDPPAEFYGNDVCGEQVFFETEIAVDGSVMMEVQLGPNSQAVLGTCSQAVHADTVSCDATEGTGQTVCTVVYDCPVALC
ncbi:hypothetical protein BDZ89DRAFT_242303 [Hymenopellis radicata]|nr:hypothetical protein BDZ89DRAFT_242303 [Hymenopellis radicata]